MAIEGIGIPPSLSALTSAAADKLCATNNKSSVAMSSVIAFLTENFVSAGNSLDSFLPNISSTSALYGKSLTP